MTASLPRRVTAEAIGTAALVAVVVGSGIQAARLSPDAGVQLLANSLATVFGLGVLIALFGPISGAHLNPVVSLAAWLLGRRAGGPALRDTVGYVAAQLVGGVGGALLANTMFGLPPVAWSTHVRWGGPLWLGEVVATAGLVLLAFGLLRTGRDHLVPGAVAAYIGAAYWFTSSTSFANPAVTVGRAFTDTFAGIAPGSVVPFVAAQLVGAVVALGLCTAVFGRPEPAPPTVHAPAAAIRGGTAREGTAPGADSDAAAPATR